MIAGDKSGFIRDDTRERETQRRGRRESVRLRETQTARVRGTTFRRRNREGIHSFTTNRRGASLAQNNCWGMEEKMKMMKMMTEEEEEEDDDYFGL